VRLKACETLPNCARVPIAFLWSEWGPLCHTLVNRFHCSIHYRVRYSAVQVLGNSWSQLPIARTLVEDDRGVRHPRASTGRGRVMGKQTGANEIHRLAAGLTAGARVTAAAVPGWAVVDHLGSNWSRDRTY
jgi:hypothetical protein